MAMMEKVGGFVRANKKILIVLGIIGIGYVIGWVATIHIAHKQIAMHQGAWATLPMDWRNGTDSLEFKGLAEGILNNHTFQYDYPFKETMKSPGYPFFLAIVVGIIHTYFATTFIQILLTLYTAFLFFKMFSKMFDHVVAYVAVLVYLLDTTVIVHTLTIMSDVLFLAVFATFLYVLFFWNWQHVYKYMIAGLLLGVAMYIRSIALFLPFVFFPFLYFTFRKTVSFSKALQFSGIMFATALLSIVPWMMRNYEVSGKWGFNSIAAYNMYRYNVPDFESEREHVKSDEIKARMGSQLSATVLSAEKSLANVDALNKVARPYIYAHPFAYAWFHIRGMAPFFFESGMKKTIETVRELYVPDRDIGPNKPFPHAYDVLVVLDEIILFTAFFAAIYAGVRGYKNIFILLCVVIVAYFAVMTGPVAYISAPRYRMIVEPFLFALAVIGLRQVFVDVKMHSHKKLPPKSLQG